MKRLRIVEETARVSGIPPGGRWWNQAFLVSWQGAYIIKNILGTVPVYEDGSAYFVAPAGVELYFQALDANGKEIRRMGTVTQITRGETQGCIGCHEHRTDTARFDRALTAMTRPPSRIEPLSDVPDVIDYPRDIQPILDRHCVKCHNADRRDGQTDLSES